MTTVRELITEAFNRTNLVPRKRDLPSDMFTSGLILFKGLLQEYSIKDYVVAYQNEVDFIPQENILVGDGEAADVSAPKIVCPKSVLYQPNTSIDWTPMNFISYQQFYSDSYSDYIATWLPVNTNLFKLIFKPRFVAQNRKCKLIYNIEMELNDNDVISLPTPYIELLTRALAYKLCIEYPRVDQTKVQQLKDEKEDLEKSVMAQNSSNKILTREGQYRGSLLSRFDSGAFIF